MDTIAVAVHFWSKGEAKAMFLRHEGFLGVLGAFMHELRKESRCGLTVDEAAQQFQISVSHAAD
ncbi:hypothetical protein SLEP1_g32706 [Rubroshorea leprosula]|uniref:Uncharacterized protein n=1 Tax=Rubroshorea leprosula TaxID=152421 RepID=A0AAV5KED1_9ROSI|nr:hypothetical protein SLEP1_g32706 [Rubroshorea leprosula]